MVDAPDTLNTLENIEKLVALDASGKVPTTAKPKALRLRDIKEVSSVMQPRTSSLIYEQGQSEEHVDGLVKALKRSKGPLDPIVVVSFGGFWVALDGHHRLAAYKALKWSKPVPVSVLELKRRGRERVQEAMLASAGLNHKDKLRMTPKDKLNQAWRMTVGFPEVSKDRVVAATGVSQTTVANMRKARDALLNKKQTNKAWLMSQQWLIARMTWLEKIGKVPNNGGLGANEERIIGIIARGLKGAVGELTAPLLLEAISRMKLQAGFFEDLEEALKQRMTGGPHVRPLGVAGDELNEAPEL
jgi:hypothetical protein